MSKKQLYYKIGEACKLLDIQPYVLRYWEKEFPLLHPNKSRSGQRVYSAREIEIIRRIKELLYEEGYTIAGAKKKLEGELAEGDLGSADTAGAEDDAAADVADGVDVDRVDADRVDDGGASSASAPAAAAPPPSANGGFIAAAGEVDTGAAEEIQKLRSGVAAALSEAREILRRIESAEL